MSGEVFDNPTGWVARHIRRYVESGGTLGHTFNGNDALLLTTRGRRNPAVVLQVRSEIFAAIATPATASERPRLWRLMADVVPKYLVYENGRGETSPS